MEPKIQMAVAVPDDEYHRLRKETKSRGKAGYACNDKDGVAHYFYFENKVLKCAKMVNDKTENFEVMSMTEAMEKKKEMEEKNPFRLYIRDKMKSDNPTWSEEELDAKVDIVVEANETVKRLIAGGIEPELAYKIVSGVLHSEEVKEHILAELEKKKE